MERPGAPAGAAGRVEDNSLPIATAKNGPDTTQAKSTSFGCATSPPLADIAARINEAHDRVGVSERSTLEAMMEAGRLLIEAKAEVGHGGWLLWLKVNTNVSERRAQTYMRVARDLPKSAVTADLTLDGALKLLSAPETDPKRWAAQKSAVSLKSSKVEVLPPEPKPPGSSPNLLTDDVLVDRIRGDIEAAGRWGIDVAQLVLHPTVCDAQPSVQPLQMADPEVETSHSPSAAIDGINTISGTGNAGTADDTDELDVRYGPLTSREWIALSKCLYMHDPQCDPHDRRSGEPQYCSEFLQLVKVFQVPLARWADRIMAGNVMEPFLPREDDTDHAEGVE
jgi:hypothetical protein